MSANLRVGRALDVLLAASAGIVAAPVVAVLAVLVRRRLGPPWLFRSERAGLGGVPFTLYKLRSMSDEVDASGSLLPDADRLAPFGRWLRSCSLDELPELWNVLRGDMAIVGPRPLPLEYLDRYTETEAKRHDVRPGLTGWAQVNGRNASTWADRLAMDAWYVEHQSLRLDLQIIWRTIPVVLRRDDINQPGHASMPELRPAAERVK